MSHVISYQPGAIEQQIRHAGALQMACACLGKGDDLEMVLPEGCSINSDGLICDAQGNVLTKGSMHYATWKDTHNGRLVGDWDVPTGMTERQVGENAVAVIRLKGQAAKEHPYAYEVGVIPVFDAEKQTLTYALVHDFYAGGMGLEAFVGKTLLDYSNKVGNKSYAVKEAHGELLMYYQAMAARVAAEEAGHSIEFVKEEDGTLTAIVDKENVGVMQ